MVIQRIQAVERTQARILGEEDLRGAGRVVTRGGHGGEIVAADAPD